MTRPFALLRSGLAVLVVLCLLLRLAAWLLAPILPTLVVLLVVATLWQWVFGEHQ